jgi:hypothetical protein
LLWLEAMAFLVPMGIMMSCFGLWVISENDWTPLKNDVRKLANNVIEFFVWFLSLAYVLGVFGFRILCVVAIVKFVFF